MTAARRGQSELIGTILLTAVVIVFVGILGAGLLANQAQQVDNTRPNVDFETELTDTKLELVHAGGERFDFDDLRVILENSDTRTYDLADDTEWTAVSEDGDGRFEPGERISVSHSLSGDVRIVVADRSANGFVLYDRVKSL